MYELKIKKNVHHLEKYIKKCINKKLIKGASEFQPALNPHGNEDRQQFTRRAKKTLDDIIRNNIGGGKRTKKRKQKRSTNKKRRIHKKRGRMSKRR